jgi:hypothetical protein
VKLESNTIHVLISGYVITIDKFYFKYLPIWSIFNEEKINYLSKTDLCLQEINIEVSEVFKVVKKIFGKYVYSTLFIYRSYSAERRGLLRIREVPDSNLGLEADYPDWGFGGFPQFLQANARKKTYLKSGPIASFNILYNSSFMNHSIIRLYVV